MLLAVAVLLLGVNGQAMASFSDGDLIRVVYSSGGSIENATDLGSIANLTSVSTTDVLYNTNNFSISSAALGTNTVLGTTPTDANSYVVYYSALAGSPNNAWVSGPSTASSQNEKNSTYSSYFVSAIHTVNGNYQLVGNGAAQVSVTMSNPFSYYTALSGGVGNGQMNSFIPGGTTEANLAALATVGYVDQNLFYYQPSGIGGQKPGLVVADIRTYANGTTEMNPTTTPVPPSILLMGSGLLGLAGIGRKRTV